MPIAPQRSARVARPDICFWDRTVIRQRRARYIAQVVAVRGEEGADVADSAPCLRSKHRIEFQDDVVRAERSGEVEPSQDLRFEALDVDLDQHRPDRWANRPLEQL